VRKINLKAIFRGLFVGARRRVSGKPPGGSSVASSDRAKAISETGDLLPQKPPGPPADWLAKRSGGPPAHWAERVRRVAPELLQNGKRSEVNPTSQPQSPRRAQRKSPAPLRLERPSPASRSPLDSPRKPIVQTESRPDGHRRPDRRKQEPPPPSFPVSAQKRGADDLEMNSKEPPELRDTDSTVHSMTTQLQISKATAQLNPIFRNDLCANAPLRELGLGEESFSQRRKGANASKVLLRAEPAIGEPDTDERRRQVREDTPEQKITGGKI
jgi:hypothetical protein